MVERGSGDGISLSLSLWELCEGTWKKGSLLGTLKDKLKSLWRRASISIGGLLRNLERVSSTDDFERRM
jgi:hypothetical protein